jgi:hypothetical protein
LVEQVELVNGLVEGKIDRKTHISWENLSGWWLGTFFIFPYIGNNNPN